MSSPFLTAEEAAKLLGLHPKTVRRMIREGRLRATRIGKSYRILESDLAQFTGAARESRSPAARVTSVVDVEDVDQPTAERVARYLPAALNNREARPDRMTLGVIYDPERRHLKISLAGAPSRVAAMYALIDLALEARA